MNVDGSFEKGRVACAVVARFTGSREAVVWWERVAGMGSYFAEMEAVRKGLEMVKDMRIKDVVVVSDCQSAC